MDLPPSVILSTCLLSKTAQQKNLEGYVGFANLPNQVYRKSVKRGFEFTLMVVGESGLGKSTLINSLFLTDLYSPEYPGPSHRIKKTVQVEQSKVLVKEGGVQLLLTIVDTPGFGDAVDNSNCWQPVIDHIDSKFEDYPQRRVPGQQTADARQQSAMLPVFHRSVWAWTEAARYRVHETVTRKSKHHPSHRQSRHNDS
ncbi:Septin-7 CDC10 protein-like protein [Larimichthys crocea]|uniref:Septin-7 CDC10 protein-like protein n=1 Tax=Larimichthys crocea TaxID=215358 RepID=A0A6G0HTL7_LARCR|nr:Septin-7 CDC10 protein-like protein [Larimichthys crocea]